MFKSCGSASWLRGVAVESEAVDLTRPGWTYSALRRRFWVDGIHDFSTDELSTKQAGAKQGVDVTIYIKFSYFSYRSPCLWPP